LVWFFTSGEQYREHTLRSEGILKEIIHYGTTKGGQI